MCSLNGVYVPEVRDERCVRCRICIRSCPGHSVDFARLNLEIFGRQPENPHIGNYIECYTGHSENESIRHNCSSGGLATQILVFALERGLIDGALVVRMRQDNPLRPEPFIARTTQDIISASRSKYCPVPANEALEQVLMEDGRFAVVGLPCHIHAIRKAEQVLPKLKEKIRMHIGLLCSHTVNFEGTKFLLRKLRVEDVVKLDYRGGGWPGSMLVQVGDGSHLTVPYVGSWNAYGPVFSSFFFTPMRCLMCPDQTNELADISLGDAWLPESKHDKSGQSIIVARTENGKDILDFMSSFKAISLRRVDSEKVEQSQEPSLRFKKDDLYYRLLLLRSLGKETPRFNPEPDLAGSSLALLRAIFPYVNIRVSSSKHLESLLAHASFSLFRLYYGIYKFLSLA